MEIRKMKILLCLIFFFFFPLNSFCQQIPLRFTDSTNEKKWQIGFFFERGSGSGFYDINGEFRSHETFQLEDYEDDVKESFEFVKHTVGLEVYYFPTDYFVFSGRIPLSIYDMERIWRLDSPLDKIIQRDNYGRTQLDHVSLESIYRPGGKKSNFSIISEFRIPGGFDKSVLPSDSNSFLSDGAFEFFTGAEIRAKFDQLTLLSRLYYNWRGEELTDQAIIYSEFGFSSIENTMLKGILKYVSSLDSYKNPIYFDPRYTNVQENYFDIGFALMFNFDPNYLTQFAYIVRLSGKNSMKYGKAYLRFGIEL